MLFMDQVIFTRKARQTTIQKKTLSVFLTSLKHHVTINMLSTIFAYL